MEAAIQLRGISKNFGHVLAIDGIDLEVLRGEIHAIVGENGAGKSTLMHTLCGLVKPDHGSILIEGSPLALGRPEESFKAGIGLVAQHFSLVPTLTGWENVILGCEPTTPWGSTDRRRALLATQEIADKLEISFPLHVPVESLPLANRQVLEIIKALYRKAQVLILDEPTSSLSPPEGDRLFELLHLLSNAETTVLLVTHRIQEVLDHADRATVLRHGRVVSRLTREEMTSDALVTAIVGDRQYTAFKTQSQAGAETREPTLLLEDLVVDENDRPQVTGLDLQVDGGEILGIAGVAGNGQDSLLRSIVGTTPSRSGRIVFNGQDITGHSAQNRRKLGIAVIPEDRLAEGIIPELSLRDNLILGDHASFSHSRGLDFGEMETFAQISIKTFDIRADSHLQPAGSLSGGNQQKAVIARELTKDPDLLIAAQPTRGLDLGARAYVHTRLRQVSGRGGSVLLISNDLDELVELSNRIAVLYAGKIVGDQSHPNIDVSALGRMMTGRTEATNSSR